MSRYVDADGIIKRLNDMTVEGETFITAVNFAKLIVENTPTAYIVPKEKYDKLLENAMIVAEAVQKYQSDDFRKVVHGTWVWHEDEDICYCSHCGQEINAEGCVDPKKYVESLKYCMHCGAIMSESLKVHEIGQSLVDGIQAGIKGEKYG